MKKLFLLLILVISSNFHALSVTQNYKPNSDPFTNYDYLWNYFDRHYSLFDAKQINWDSLYPVYRNMITATTNDEQLFDIMSGLLSNLNDNHVNLRYGNNKFNAGILQRLEMQDFSLDVIKNKYLKEYKTKLNRDEGRSLLQYGRLDDSTGYIHISGFNGVDEITKAMDEILEEFKNMKQIIVDVRSNGGGDDKVANTIANRFAAEKRLFMTTRIRYGISHTDFSTLKYWYTKPEGKTQFLKPVILLTHRHSISAAENFTLAMRTLDNVTILGDTTSGAFSDRDTENLPNGWQFTISYKLFSDQNGICFEGIGLAPDISKLNTKEDIAKERDMVLEYAIGYLNMGTSNSKTYHATVPSKESIAEIILSSGNSTNTNDLMSSLKTKLSENPDRYYLNDDEMREAAFMFMFMGKPSDAAEVLKFNNEINTNSFYYYSLEYLRLLIINDIKSAELVFNEAVQSKISDFLIKEGTVNNIGYFFMNAGMLDRAIEVFKAGTLTFPDSFNVYDSLGEAYMKLGNKELAKKNYEKSLELNPENENARTMLEKLK